MASKKKSKLNWYHIDLHLHTPASIDYHNKDISYLDILKQAEAKGLDIIAFTDHNTVNGYAAMQREIEQLRYLKELGRARDEEIEQLAEYQRLLDKILVLPGFEFTATFGFHILGIFSPDKSLREIEHLLMNLNVPLSAIEEGNSEVGASSDVIHAYELINEAGGIVIAAHANAGHGVAMRGMDFGGQTRIAYTQHSSLHCLEVTDLGSKRRNSTPRFFNGTKPEYPRKMRCIQGSDAHALETITDRRGKVVTLGVGERTTEVLLADQSFDALLEMLKTNDFSRSREYEGGAGDDYVQSAREEGVSILQSFHESMARKGGYMYGIVSDVCAFANTNGGTVYVGVSEDPSKPVKGVPAPPQSVNEIAEAIGRMITPELQVEIDTLESGGKTVLRVQVPQGMDRPYVIDEYKIYVRDDNESNLAVRDEIVNLVRQGLAHQGEAVNEAPATKRSSPFQSSPARESRPNRRSEEAAVSNGNEAPAESEASVPVEAAQHEAESANPNGIPRAGVEIIGTEQRNGTNYHIMRDLRNNNIVNNVTRESARRLWHYAIKQRESNPVDPNKVHWAPEGDIGLWRSYKRGTDVRYDLVKKENGKFRVFYGVSEAGMSGRWQQFLEPDEE